MDPGPGSLPWVQQFWAWDTIISASLLSTLPLLSSGTDPRPLAIGWPCDPRWATVIGPGIATDSEPSQSEPFSGLPLVEGPPSWWSSPERQRGATTEQPEVVVVTVEGVEVSGEENQRVAASSTPWIPLSQSQLRPCLPAWVPSPPGLDAG